MNQFFEQLSRFLPWLSNFFYNKVRSILQEFHLNFTSTKVLRVLSCCTALRSLPTRQSKFTVETQCQGRWLSDAKPASGSWQPAGPDHSLSTGIIYINMPTFPTHYIYSIHHTITILNQTHSNAYHTFFLLYNRKNVS